MLNQMFVGVYERTFERSIKRSNEHLNVCTNNHSNICLFVCPFKHSNAPTDDKADSKCGASDPDTVIRPGGIW